MSRNRKAIAAICLALAICLLAASIIWPSLLFFLPVVAILLINLAVSVTRCLPDLAIPIRLGSLGSISLRAPPTA